MDDYLEILERMEEPLVGWYDKNARILPWRQVKSPYRTWVSEIMLQQTRVEAVKPYFNRFMEELPSIPDLARVSEDKLFKLWEGLGYYSRARNLQKAAKVLMVEYDGDLPKDHDALLKLSGIGPYTAGAIASIAFGLPYAAVDGNVYRVVTRILQYNGDITRPEVKKEVASWMDKIMRQNRPGDFNQALMELGATVCLPNGVPKCNLCPLQFLCKAHEENRALDFPVKSPKKERKIEEKSVFFVVSDGKIALGKRQEKGLLSGLWEFPNATGQDDFESLLSFGITDGIVTKLGRAKHIFTHIEWHMEGYFVETKTLSPAFVWVSKEELEQKYALPSAFRKIKEKGLDYMD